MAAWAISDNTPSDPGTGAGPIPPPSLAVSPADVAAEVAPASCCGNAGGSSHNLVMTRLQLGRYGWIPALALSLWGVGWLARFRRRRDARIAIPGALPPPSRQRPVVLALTWDGSVMRHGLADARPKTPNMEASMRPDRHDAGESASPHGNAPSPERAQPPSAVSHDSMLQGGVLSQEILLRRASAQGLFTRTPFLPVAAVQGELFGQPAGSTWVRPAQLDPGSLAGSLDAPGPALEAPGDAMTGTHPVAATPAPAVDGRPYMDNIPAPDADVHAPPFEAEAEPDEWVVASVLDERIQALREIPPMERDAKALRALGEACHQRALIGPHVDDDLLAEAEAALRIAVSEEARPDAESVWELQRVLRVVPTGWGPKRVVPRLLEARDLLAGGLAFSPGHAAWRGALLQAELQYAQHASPHVGERRLRLRELHAAWAAPEQRPESVALLVPWIDVLCAMAESVTGRMAADRYAEAGIVLERLHVQGDERAYARAFARIGLSRAMRERHAARTNLLDDTEAVLAPWVDCDRGLRLQACRIALARAQEAAPEVALRCYQQAVELARPLTAVPTLAIDALRCMLAALLALGEEKERVVYARCLEVVVDSSDALSLQLLAESGLRAGDHRRGCLYAEQAWRAGAVLPSHVLRQWQEAQSAWAALESGSMEARRNRHCLRLAASVPGERACVAF
ncbi:hypothetical protein [Dyella sp. C9]|uniref:hypothetical protein n=1 Tax=Dyella sp. C9 TaxID=2202154 RepID=UPI00130028DA|nr:hypothetical protein [Dyella sp. C9]